MGSQRVAHNWATELNKTELRVTFAKESIMGTKHEQTVTDKVILELWGQLEPTDLSVPHLLQSHNSGWLWREMGVICYHATCILGPRQRRWGGHLTGSGGVMCQQLYKCYIFIFWQYDVTKKLPFFCNCSACHLHICLILTVSCIISFCSVFFFFLSFALFFFFFPFIFLGISMSKCSANEIPYFLAVNLLWCFVFWLCIKI